MTNMPLIWDHVQQICEPATLLNHCPFFVATAYLYMVSNLADQPVVELSSPDVPDHHCTLPEHDNILPRLADRHQRSTGS
jgi:hypothetical protein